jgi:hypothetical protein
MRKRLLRFSLLTVLAVGSTAFATEFRSPWLSERGPIRYVFEKKDAKRYSLDLWTTGYIKYANKAYMEHSVDTKPLTELFFNKSEFKIMDAFSHTVQEESILYANHNPYLHVAKFFPRATYFDWGMDFGGRFEYPVYKDKGRIGLRATIPFRTVRIERDDDAERNATGDQSAVLRNSWRQGETILNIGGGAHANQGELFKQDIWAWAINGELLRQLPFIFAGNIEHSIRPFDGGIGVLGYSYQFSGNAPTAHRDAQAAAALPVTGAGLVFSYFPREHKRLPDHKVGALKFDNQANDHTGVPLIERNFIRDDFSVGTLESQTVWPVDGPNGAGNNDTNQVPAELTKLPTSGNPFAENKFYMVYNFDGQDKNYSDFPKYQWENIWLSSVHSSDGNRTGLSDGMINDIENTLQAYNEDLDDWLWEHDFVFATHERTGLGDIDLDLFYEHAFNDKWNAELFVGVRFPTGIGDDYYTPYMPALGNGEHFEIKVGGMIAWQPLKWMNTKLDAYVSFVLESTEERAAVYEHSKIKNIGPKTSADVDWTYFVGRLDFNFFHPKTNDLSSTIGYEFYYKSEDEIHFKHSKMFTWLGRKWDNDSQAWMSKEDSEVELSNKLAEANTEAISHKIRFEGRYQANKWLEMFAGGSYVFAGEHVSADADCHAGVNVKF